MNKNTQENYKIARAIYAEAGVDTDAALEKLRTIPVSIHCWQGDDVKGFMSGEELTGGIQTTGNYPGRARCVSELRQDISKALSLIPGKHKLSLHAIYAETDGKTDINELEPRHFSGWVDYAKEENIGLDFNPTCFSHPMAASGFTISSADKAVRDFWIEHCKRSRRISEYFGRSLGIKSVNNLWFPDGYKDIPYDRMAPRIRMAEALDEVISEKLDPKYHLDALESKLFGIGVESYTVASNEFALGYAASRNIAYTLDSGHFHPTEVISDKISSVLMYTDELNLHVSRPVRWDSDHVVIYDDELNAVASAIVRDGLTDRTHIGLDYFDASINRIAAWVIGTRNMIKALLRSLLEPAEKLRNAELDGDYTSRLAITEELKSYPFGAVWDHYCDLMGVPVRDKWLSEVKDYEKEVLSKR